MVRDARTTSTWPGRVPLRTPSASFTEVVKDDSAAGRTVQKTCAISQVAAVLYPPRFSTQASRLVGASRCGTTTLTTTDATGSRSQTTLPYAKSWGLEGRASGRQLIVNDYTDLRPA